MVAASQGSAEEQKELLARMFKYLAQENNPHIVRKVSFDRIGGKTYYRNHKKAFDKLHHVMVKYGIRPYNFIKFAIEQTNVYTPELILKPSLFLEYAKRLNERECLEKVYSNYIRSVSNVAKICVEKKISPVDFIKESISGNRIAYEYMSGRMSKYFIVAIPNFVKIYDLLDKMNKEELCIIYNAAEELRNVLQDACLMKTGGTARPIHDVTEAMKKLNENKNKPEKEENQE